MSKFKVGDWVKCVNRKGRGGSSAGAGWVEGLVFKIKEVVDFTDYSCCFGGQKGYGVYSNYLELVKDETSSPYSSLKSRIEAINENTTVKEWDDICNKIQIQREVNIYQDRTSGMGDITIKLYVNACTSWKQPITERFNYKDQCEKVKAHKDALLWLLDHSDIKKDEELKTGDYAVAVDPAYFDGSRTIKGLKVGDVFKPYKIEEGYCYISDNGANCFLSKVRKATAQEIEDYLKKKDNNKEKIAELQKQVDDIQKQIRELQ